MPTQCKKWKTIDILGGAKFVTMLDLHHWTHFRDAHCIGKVKINGGSLPCSNFIPVSQAVNINNKKRRKR